MASYQCMTYSKKWVEIVRQESPDDPRRRSRLWHKEDVMNPGWFTDHKLMGFAICLLIHGYLTVNQRMCKVFTFSYVQVESSHLWLCYLPRHEFLDHQWLHMHTELEFSFTFIGTVMKMCGVRVVYEEDAKAFIKWAYIFEA